MVSRPYSFVGGVPENYDRYLRPFLFAPYAVSMAARVALSSPRSVLELACGTGALTTELDQALHPNCSLTATDLSPDMLAVVRRNWSGREAIVFREADACSLPFADESFDVVVCQFGVMMFPDKAAAMTEALRVLKPGGALLTSAWQSAHVNPNFRVIEETLAEMFPHEETPFMPTPVSMPDPEIHRTLAREAGFQSVAADIETHHVGPYRPADLASGYTTGTPLGTYLAEQGYDMEAVHARLTQAFAREMGDPMYGDLSAVVCRAVKGAARA